VTFKVLRHGKEKTVNNRKQPDVDRKTACPCGQELSLHSTAQSALRSTVANLVFLHSVTGHKCHYLYRYTRKVALAVSKHEKEKTRLATESRLTWPETYSRGAIKL